MIKKKKKLFFVGLCLILIITIFIYTLKNKNNFHQYYNLKNLIFGDQIYNNLKMINTVTDEKVKKFKSGNKDFTINWSFRPEHFHPIYPKLSVADINGDGVKEIYLGSQTQKIYEINSISGEVNRTWQFPIGQASSKGTFLYKKNNKNYLLTTSTISLPIKLYSLDLNKKEIEEDWNTDIHGQFVESGLNISKDRIVVATRDAPYSKGSLYIFDKSGEKIFGPEKKIDVCNSRPIIEDGYFIHGSHNFYSAEHGNAILKRKIDTGDIVWKKNMNFDTGFLTSNLIEFNNDQLSDVVVYNSSSHQSSSSLVLNGKNGEILSSINGLLLDKNNENKLLIEFINKKRFNKYIETLLILRENNFFDNNVGKLIKYLVKNNEIHKFDIYYLGLLSKYFNISEFHLKDLILVNPENRNLEKTEYNNIRNKISFFGTSTNAGENYFILTDNSYSKFEFHIFYIFMNKLIYFIYDKTGSLMNYKIIDIKTNSFDNKFVKEFYKNNKNPKFPAITIAKISDLDNDNKLEIILTINNSLYSVNLNIKNIINYDISNYPNKKNDNFIFKY